MKDNLTEDKIIHSFDSMSVEDMDKFLSDINPCDFGTEDGFHKKRIEKRVLKNTRAGTVKRVKRFRGLAAAAVLIVCTVGFFSVNVEARELLKKLFSFIPGVGVVESDMKYYVLSDKASETDATYSVEDENLRIEVKSASIKDDIVTVNYVAELKNIDPESVMNLMTDGNPETAEVNKLMADLYDRAGYGSCFDISEAADSCGQIIRSTKASLDVSNREYLVETSKCVFGEASDWKKLDIQDEFAIDISSFDASKALKLKIGNLETELLFVEASQYETKEELHTDNNTCTREDVTLVADPVWEEDAFYVDVYVSDYGQYTSLDSLWGGTGCVSGRDESYPYITVGDSRVIGRVDSERTEGYHFVFDYEEIGRRDSYELHIPVISMVKDEELTFELGEGTEDALTDRYERKVISRQPENPVVERVIGIPRNPDEDPYSESDCYAVYEDNGFGENVVECIRIDIENDVDNGRLLSWYKNSSYDGIEIGGIYNIFGFDANEENYVNMNEGSPYEGMIYEHRMIIPLGKKFEDVKTITLKNAVYDLCYDFTFELSR